VSNAFVSFDAGNKKAPEFRGFTSGDRLLIFPQPKRQKAEYRDTDNCLLALFTPNASRTDKMLKTQSADKSMPAFLLFPNSFFSILPFYQDKIKGYFASLSIGATIGVGNFSG